jgi:mannose-6-phosphate isomerase-like protein (cupin superfamily)
MLSIFDEDSVPVGGDALQWVPLRRRLGIAAFGTNAYRATRTGDVVIEEHVESPGQEELYVVLRGRAEFKVGEDAFEGAAGAAVFVSQPGVRRQAIALEDETVVLAVGGWTDRAYHSLPWEPIYLASSSCGVATGLLPPRRSSARRVSTGRPRERDRSVPPCLLPCTPRPA